MHIIHTIAGLQPEFGGPSRSVPALATALAQAGAQVELVTCKAAVGQPVPLLPPHEWVTSHLLPYSCRSTQWLPRTNTFASVLRERCRGANACVIHDHGLWLPTNHAVAFAARTLKVPRMVSPRGMLTAWALQHRGLKKRVAWRLYQKRDLETAQALHATSADEAAAFRAVGLTQPIAIIPNGVELPPGNRKSEIGNRKSEIRTVLFLGRIHPVKGLLDLVRAWAAINRKSEIGNRKSNGWRMVVAGGGEARHVIELKAEIRKLKLETSFEFIGPVDGEAKWELYRAADLFLLPSHSENFGIVVAEALACGVPAIATRGCPWEDLATHQCGWWTENGPEGLAVGLRDALGRSDDERAEMGQRGRRLVEDKYSWPGIAAQMCAVYHWMLGEGTKPNCILD